ncbi:MAG: hypothetical protein KGJ06_09510, partial [Pseudomonadota bacterium]|nr:hypothetical protein [Pseudomonadota bacterium]
MAEMQETKIPDRKSLLRTLQGNGPVLPFNESPVISDREYVEQREKIVSRSKLWMLWSGASRAFNMIAGTMISAGIALVVGALAHSGAIEGAALVGAQVLFGVGAVSLAAGIAADYFENMVRLNQNLDTTEI